MMYVHDCIHDTGIFIFMSEKFKATIINVTFVSNTKKM